MTYEHIAKEGLNFGLSLIIASQRLGEIRQTIIGQCANFVSHRLIERRMSCSARAASAAAIFVLFSFAVLIIDAC
jgi:DNA helicase HerA-like ATPase